MTNDYHQLPEKQNSPATRRDPEKIMTWSEFKNLKSGTWQEYKRYLKTKGALSPNLYGTI